MFRRHNLPLSRWSGQFPWSHGTRLIQMCARSFISFFFAAVPACSNRSGAILSQLGPLVNDVGARSPVEMTAVTRVKTGH